MQFLAVWEGMQGYERKLAALPVILRRISRNLDLSASQLPPHDRQLNLHYVLRLRLLWAGGQAERLEKGLMRVPHWKLPHPQRPEFDNEFTELLSNLRHEAATEHLDELRECTLTCEHTKSATKS
eukprot:1830235-Amphidinium_carterae.1